MHRINTKKRRTIVLRFVAYGITVVLSILTTALLVYIALGYQFDRRSGRVIHSGLLLVNAQPSGTDIYLDGQLRSDVPGRFVLSGGKYTLLLQQNGYRSWSKQIVVQGSAVETIRYPLLVPNELDSTALSIVGRSPAVASQSPDKKTLLLQREPGQDVVLVELDDQAPIEQPLELSAALESPLGSLNVLDWSRDSSRVLVEHRAGDGTREIISLHTRNTNEHVNLTQRYQKLAPTQLQYGDNDEVYGISTDNILTRYSLRETRRSALLENVFSYAFSDTDKLAFVRLSKDASRLEAGVLDGQSPVILHAIKHDTPSDLAVESIEYEGAWYVAVASPSERRVDIYRNPLDTPILARQLPFTSLASPTHQLLASPSDRFLLLQNGQRSLVYDFDSLRSHSFTAPYKLRSTRDIWWLTDYHLGSIDRRGQSFMVDFDGTNRQQLQDVTKTTSIYLDDKQESLYYFTARGLQHTSLLINE